MNNFSCENSKSEKCYYSNEFILQSGKYKVGQDANGIYEGIHVASHTVKQLEMVSLKTKLFLNLGQLEICSDFLN